MFFYCFIYIIKEISSQGGNEKKHMYIRAKCIFLLVSDQNKEKKIRRRKLCRKMQIAEKKRARI